MERQDINIEKSKEIAEKCQIIHGWKRAEAFRECYDSASMMAEWKDSQLMDYVARRCRELDVQPQKTLGGMADGWRESLGAIRELERLLLEFGII